MDDATLKALKESIQHWRDNAAAKKIGDASVGPENCALCDLFYADSWLEDCYGCPIKNRTGEPYCNDTPYVKADRAFLNWRDYPLDEALAGIFRNHAQDMVKFLESLLPEEAC